MKSKVKNKSTENVSTIDDCEGDLQEGLTMFVLFIGLMIMGYSMSCFGATELIISGTVTLLATGIALALECNKMSKKDKE